MAGIVHGLDDEHVASLADWLVDHPPAGENAIDRKADRLRAEQDGDINLVLLAIVQAEATGRSYSHKAYEASRRFKATGEIRYSSVPVAVAPAARPRERRRSSGAARRSTRSRDDGDSSPSHLALAAWVRSVARQQRRAHRRFPHGR